MSNNINKRVNEPYIVGEHAELRGLRSYSVYIFGCVERFFNQYKSYLIVIIKYP